MPRYDYECESCHHRFELRQSFDSEPVAACPECQNRSTRKFHSVPIVFKGSGFYKTDSRKEPVAESTGAKADSSDSSSDENASSSDNSSSDSSSSDSSSTKESSSKDTEAAAAS